MFYAIVTRSERRDAKSENQNSRKKEKQRKQSESKLSINEFLLEAPIFESTLYSHTVTHFIQDTLQVGILSV